MRWWTMDDYKRAGPHRRDFDDWLREAVPRDLMEQGPVEVLLDEGGQSATFRCMWWGESDRDPVRGNDGEVAWKHERVVVLAAPPPKWLWDACGG